MLNFLFKQFLIMNFLNAKPLTSILSRCSVLVRTWPGSLPPDHSASSTYFPYGIVSNKNQLLSSN